MKKIIFYLLVFYCTTSKGQSNIFSFSDVIIGSGSGLKSAIDYTPYIPNSSTPMKYIRINFHFMLKTGHTSNFTETSDGVSSNSTYTGYYFAKTIVNTANYRLSINSKSNLPPSNTTPILAPKYCFVLDGVYFHEDEANYYYNNTAAVSRYSVNQGSVINVFMEGKNLLDGSSAHANMGSPCFIEFNGAWETYKELLLNPPYPNALNDFMWVKAGGICHEAGHNMGLFHTLMDGNGSCNLNAEDNCIDTPTGQQMITNFGAPQMCCLINGLNKTCCGWNDFGPFCSNNMMDYSGDIAITPNQLGIVHYAFSHYMLDYQVCKTLQNNLNVTTFSDDKILYSGNIVSIPSIAGTNMIVKSGQSKTITFSNSLTLNGGFEVQLGGELEVSNQNYCP